MGFGKKMKKVWDVGFSGKRSGNVGSGSPYQTLPLLVTSPRTEISSRVGRGETLLMKGWGCSSSRLGV